MTAIARKALLPALLLGLVAFPAQALANHNDLYTNAVALQLDERDVIDNIDTGPDAPTDAPEPLTISGNGWCKNGQFNDPPPADPGPDPGVDMINTVWYEVPGNGRPVTIDLRGSEPNTVAAVYLGNAAPSKATFRGCADDIWTGAEPDRTTELTFSTSSNTSYLVQVGTCRGCPTPEGAYPEEGTIDFLPWASPTNDSSSSPAALTAGTVRSSRLSGATTVGGERRDCRGAPYSRTVWFSYTAPGPGTAVFNASGSSVDTVLAVYRGGTFIDCNDDGNPAIEGPSRLRVRVSQGTYLVQVGGYGTAPAADYGNFSASVDFAADQIPPKPDSDGDGVTDDVDKCPGQNAAARDANRDGCLDPDPDPDRDGVPVGTDKCPNQNARARDKNGDGCLDKLRLSADLKLQARGTATGIRIKSLKVQAPKGSKVTVRCGRRCKFVKKATVSRSGDVLATVSRLVAVKKVYNRSFRAGQKIRIYVTQKNRIGVYFQLAIKRGDVKETKRCLNPGSMKPRKRCR